MKMKTRKTAKFLGGVRIRRTDKNRSIYSGHVLRSLPSSNSNLRLLLYPRTLSWLDLQTEREGGPILLLTR